MMQLYFIRLIKKLWETSWDTWDHRNKWLNDDGVDHLLGITRLYEDIITAYDTPRQYFMPEDDQALFRSSLLIFSRELHNLKHAWFENHGQTLQFYDT